MKEKSKKGQKDTCVPSGSEVILHTLLFTRLIAFEVTFAQTAFAVAIYAVRGLSELCSPVFYGKKSFLSKESDTKILQSVYFAYEVGTISSYLANCAHLQGSETCNRQGIRAEQQAVLAANCFALFLHICFDQATWLCCVLSGLDCSCWKRHSCRLFLQSWTALLWSCVCFIPWF